MLPGCVQCIWCKQLRFAQSQACCTTGRHGQSLLTANAARFCALTSLGSTAGSPAYQEWVRSGNAGSALCICSLQEMQDVLYAYAACRVRLAGMTSLCSSCGWLLTSMPRSHHSAHTGAWHAPGRLTDMRHSRLTSTSANLVRSSILRRLGSGWRRSKARRGKAVATTRAMLILASSMNSSTSWLAVRCTAGQQAHACSMNASQAA